MSSGLHPGHRAVENHEEAQKAPNDQSATVDPMEPNSVKLYRRLRSIETELQTELTAPQVTTLQTELESIDRAARILPMRHSDLFHSVMGLIIRTRTDLATRLAEVRSQTAKVA